MLMLSLPCDYEFQSEHLMSRKLDILDFRMISHPPDFIMVHCTESAHTPDYEVLLQERVQASSDLTLATTSERASQHFGMDRPDTESVTQPATCFHAAKLSKKTRLHAPAYRHTFDPA